MNAFDVLERQLHDAAGRRRRRVRWAPVLLLATAVAAAAIAAIVLLDRSRPLVEREAQVVGQGQAMAPADPAQIVYVRATSTRVEIQRGKEQRSTAVLEEWHRGRENHRLEVWTEDDGSQRALDHVIDAGGVMRQITEDGSYRIARRSDNEDAENVLAREQAGFLADFARRVEQGRLDPAGDVQFAGRPARRYLGAVDSRMNSPEQAFYVDRETGAPLGYTSTIKQSGFENAMDFEFVQTVRAMEYLEPTPENLAKLRTLTLPRRRDADGCIRGPVESARSIDSASKRDCGGVPSAPIDG